MAKLKMPDVIVLLPGILGSVLKKNGKVVWGFSAKSIGKALLTLGKSMEKDLALPNDDPVVEDLGDGVVADSLMPDLHLLPGIWKIDGYSKVAEAIMANFEVTEGKNFLRFPYDWRRDNRVAARKLAEASRGWLREWRESSGSADAKLILIAHSMGGLVSRYFLECMEGWKCTRALVSFGTPYFGSLNALEGLANGIEKGPLHISALARQLTSLYQLLPIFECYDTGDGKLVRVGEGSGIPNVDKTKAASALAFHHEIETAVAANRKLPQFDASGYQIYPIVGISQQTNWSARLADGRVTMLTHRGDDSGGDGTVPRLSAIPQEMQNKPVSAMYAGTQHGSLQNADAVITHVTGLISQFYVGKLRGKGKPPIPKTPVALEVEDMFFADEPIVVRAHPEKGDAALKATLYRHGNRQPVVTKQMKISSADWRSAEFAPPGAGAYNVTVTGIGAETAEDSLVVVETTANDV